MKQIFYLFASCLVLLLLSPHIALAVPQGAAVGTVVAVRGDVSAISKTGAQRRLSLKSHIFRDDTIKTGNGRIQLMFLDHTLISLGRKSEMVVARYHWQPDRKTGAMKTRIKEGTFRVMGGAITKVAPGNFSTQTPAATIGIRGSMYAGRATPKTLMVVFQAGKGIDVTNASGSVGITRPGFGTRVTGLNRPPMRPFRFTAKDLAALNASLSMGGGKAKEKKGAGQKKEKQGGKKQSQKNGSQSKKGESAEGKKTQQKGESTPPAKQGKENGSKAGSGSTASSGGGEQSGTASSSESSGQTETTTSGSGSSQEGAVTQTPTTSSSQGSTTTTETSLSSFDQTTDTAATSGSTASSTLTDTASFSSFDTSMSTGDTSMSTTDSSTTAFASPDTTITTDLTADLTSQIGAIVTNTTTSAQQDSVTQTVATQASASPSSTTTSTTPSDTGRLLAYLEDTTSTSPTLSAYSYGSLDGTAQAGSFSGVSTDQNGTTSNLAFDLTLANPSGSYNQVFTGWDSSSSSSSSSDYFSTLANFSREVSILGSPQTLDWAEANYDSLGEFVIYNGGTSFSTSTQQYDYNEIGYSGLPATSLPTSSIAVYTGPFSLLKTGVGQSYSGASDLSMLMWVNFQNDTALGFIGGNSSNAYLDGGLFYGKISGNELTGLHFMGVGTDPATSRDLFHELTGETGTFFGSAYQGFGWTGTGSTVFSDTGASAGSFEALGVGFRGTQELSANMTDQHWKGYLAGMADTGSTSQPLLLDNANGSASDLQINLDAAAGTAGGTLSLNNLLTGVSFGASASLSSAYVDPSWFFAALPTGSASAPSIGGVIAPAWSWEQWSPYFTWGWWALFYNDGTNYYSNLQTNNYWIAGNLTSDLNPSILSSTLGSGATGTYHGQARALLYDSSGGSTSSYQDLAGKANFTINFGSNSFTGLLDFSPQGGPGLSYSGSVGTNGIHATALAVNGTASTNTSFLNGNFFGANMEALAGNFGADLSTTSSITGIFGGEDSSPQPVSLSGKYMGMITDNDPSLSNEEIWKGDISAQTEDGAISGTATTVASDGTTAKSFPLSFFSPETTASSPADIGAVDGWNSSSSSDWQWWSGNNSAQRTVNLLGTNQVFGNVDFQSYDPAEFSYFIQQGRSFGTSPNNGYFSELGFMGTPSASITATGVETFSGDAIISGYLNNDLNTLSQDNGWWQMGVNWDNGKVVGIVNAYSGCSLNDCPGGTTVFFGDVDKASGQVTNVTVVGSLQAPDTSGTISPFGIDGSGTFGQFYGSSHQGFGSTTEGGVYDLGSATTQGQWDAIAAGFKNASKGSEASATGTTTWNGFVVGLAEDVQSPDTNRHIFVNSSPTDFTMNIDRDTGVISGTLFATTMDGSTNITGMEIGGSHGSAYAGDRWLAAATGCAVDSTCVDNSSGSAATESAGSYLVSSPDSDANAYTSWGYWETAYVEPGTGNHYHVYQPGSMWVAGERTPESYVQSLITAGSFTGTYTGSAQAYRIDATDSTIRTILNGKTDLTVNFGAQTVTGGFAFTKNDNPALSADKNLQLANGVVSASGFTAKIQGAAASQVSGAFFGPQVNSVGGAFGAKITNDGTYTGVFGGKLTNGPAPSQP